MLRAILKCLELGPLFAYNLFLVQINTLLLSLFLASDNILYFISRLLSFRLFYSSDAYGPLLLLLLVLLLPFFFFTP